MWTAKFVNNCCNFRYSKGLNNTLVLQVHSVCPSIYGHELVKASLLLGLFGGCQRYAGSGTHVPIRGDPHILVVGDPGLGKSQVSGCCCSDVYLLLGCVCTLLNDVFLEGLTS